MDFDNLARKVIQHCRTIGAFTDQPGAITRTFLSNATKTCHAYLSNWMAALGMQVDLDAAGNLRGHYPGQTSSAKLLMIGSHLDTVPDAGAFDGVLGVVMGLALVEALQGERLLFAIEVIGLSEEEGVRFGFPFIGSRALIGTLSDDALQATDGTGISVSQVIENFGLDSSRVSGGLLRKNAAAYLEFHIEQGPVLESLHLSLGVVSAIVGQSRAKVIFRGKANHAGTTPMALRQDALCATAEWITLVEAQARASEGLVATVGRMEIKPGAANVIPGEVAAMLDVRHLSDDFRRSALEDILQAGSTMAQQRGLQFYSEILLDQLAVPLDDDLTSRVEQAIATSGATTIRMTSGAGHDSMIVAPWLPSAMMFLRSPGGISHHPDESVNQEDVAAALRAGFRLLQNFQSCSYLS